MNNGKYQVLKVEVVESGERPQWRIDLGIRRMWPLSWYDLKYPVKKFIGSGYAWCEIRQDKAYAVGGLTPVLNAIASEEALKLITSEHQGRIKVTIYPFDEGISWNPNNPA